MEFELKLKFELWSFFSKAFKNLTFIISSANFPSTISSHLKPCHQPAMSRLIVVKEKLFALWKVIVQANEPEKWKFILLDGLFAKSWMGEAKRESKKHKNKNLVSTQPMDRRTIFRVESYFLWQSPYLLNCFITSKRSRTCLLTSVRSLTLVCLHKSGSNLDRIIYWKEC